MIEFYVPLRLQSLCSRSIRRSPGGFSHGRCPSAACGAALLPFPGTFYFVQQSFLLSWAPGWHLCRSRHRCHLGHASRFPGSAACADRCASQAFTEYQAQWCVLKYSVFHKAPNTAFPLAWEEDGISSVGFRRGICTWKDPVIVFHV